MMHKVGEPPAIGPGAPDPGGGPVQCVFAGIPYPDYMTLPPNREDLIRWAQSVDLDGVTAVQLILTFT